MATVLDDTKRQAIATRLTTLKAIKNLLISNEQKLMPAVGDEDIRERLEFKMLSLP